MFSSIRLVATNNLGSLSRLRGQKKCQPHFESKMKRKKKSRKGKKRTKSKRLQGLREASPSTMMCKNRICRMYPIHTRAPDLKVVESM